jgi:hypothetical protein
MSELEMDGVTVIVAVIGVVPVFITGNDAILSVPLAGKPMEGEELVQLNIVPVTEPLNGTTAVEAPLQSTWLATAFTVGVGFTVIVNVTGAPVQVTPALVYEGVTVTVAAIGAAVVFTAAKLAIFPVPLTANPMEVVLLVQL